MSDFTGLYNIRPAKHSDYAFIYASFLKGVYYGNPWFSMIPKDIFMQNYKPVADTLIYSPNTAILVACLPDDPDTILGYSITQVQGDVLAWVYVKAQWRKHGIGRSLIPTTPTSVTHLTELGKSLLHKFENKPIFNPFQGG